MSTKIRPLHFFSCFANSEPQKYAQFAAARLRKDAPGIVFTLTSLSTQIGKQDELVES
jgi:hypothetical protein